MDSIESQISHASSDYDLISDGDVTTNVFIENIQNQFFLLQEKKRVNHKLVQ
jgi:hypothetical protein